MVACTDMNLVSNGKFCPKFMRLKAQFCEFSLRYFKTNYDMILEATNWLSLNDRTFYLSYYRT